MRRDDQGEGNLVFSPVPLADSQQMFPAPGLEPEEPFFVNSPTLLNRRCQCLVTGHCQGAVDCLNEGGGGGPFLTSQS